MNPTNTGAMLPTELMTTAVAMPQTETTAVAVAEQARALIESRYKMALARPRDWDMVRTRLLKDAMRPGFAATAIYNKPIGKGVTGPSIRFAEAAIRAMTNVVSETMTVFDDASRRIVRVTVTDLEANTPWSQDVTIEKTVERSRLKDGEIPIASRTNSKGYPVYIVPATDDDILNKTNAMISKAVRTLALRLLPGDIQEDALFQCRETMRKGNAAMDPDAARIKMFDIFAQVQVTPEQLKAYLDHDCARFSSEEHEHLRGIWTALRDGETNWREVMEAKERKKQDESPKATPEPVNVGAGAGKAGRLANALGGNAQQTPAPTTTTTERTATA